MFGIPSPWILLGALVAFIGAFLAGNIHGHSAENTAWEAKEQRQIAENIQAARKTESAQNVRNAEIERKYLDEQTKSDDLAKQLTAAVAGGVRLKGACAKSVPATPAAAGSVVTESPGDGILPEAIGRDLVNLAREAERVLGIARAGESHAVEP